MAQLPARCEEAARRFSERIGKHMLSALEDASCFIGIEAVHLVAALGQERGRSPASLSSMGVSVKEELFRSVLEQAAIAGMRGEWPLPAPVRDHAEREATAHEGREVADHRPSLSGVGWSGVVNTDEEGSHARGISYDKYFAQESKDAG
jgi:hypothetical protein